MERKSKLKVVIESITGLKIFRKLPFGIDQFNDISIAIDNYKMLTVLDVGANTGQSAILFRKYFPKSNIHCFEPIKETYNKLLNNTRYLDCNCHNIALGSENNSVTIKIDNQNTSSKINSLVETNFEKYGGESEVIRIEKLDDFCISNKIKHIELLKIDTEGFDLEVLKGARKLLEANSIDFVETEVSMNKYNTFHVDFFDVRNYLHSFDYYVFGIYEQVQEWKLNLPVLRRSNVVFISKRLHEKATNLI